MIFIFGWVFLFLLGFGVWVWVWIEESFIFIWLSFVEIKIYCVCYDYCVIGKAGFCMGWGRRLVGLVVWKWRCFLFLFLFLIVLVLSAWILILIRGWCFYFVQFLTNYLFKVYPHPIVVLLRCSFGLKVIVHIFLLFSILINIFLNNPMLLFLFCIRHKTE